MIIALPLTNHDHLADALVRDLGFTRQHVDAPLRELLLALDPYVDSGTTMANMGTSPRLSSKLAQQGGTSDEERWSRLLHPVRPGAASDRTAAEVVRLLEVLRGQGCAPVNCKGDTVVVGGESLSDLDHVYADDTQLRLIAIDGRSVSADVQHWIAPAGVVGEQEAIVAYVQELRQPDGRQSAKFAEVLLNAGYTSEQIDEARSGPPPTLAERIALIREAEASLALDGGTQSFGPDVRYDEATNTWIDPDGTVVAPLEDDDRAD